MGLWSSLSRTRRPLTNASVSNTFASAWGGDQFVQVDGVFDGDHLSSSAQAVVDRYHELDYSARRSLKRLLTNALDPGRAAHRKRLFATMSRVSPCGPVVSDDFGLALGSQLVALFGSSVRTAARSRREPPRSPCWLGESNVRIPHAALIARIVEGGAGYP